MWSLQPRLTVICIITLSHLHLASVVKHAYKKKAVHIDEYEEKRKQNKLYQSVIAAMVKFAPHTTKLLQRKIFRDLFNHANRRKEARLPPSDMDGR